MEFEKDTPATQEQIDLADAAKVTLQPFSAEISSEPLNTNRTHQNEATFGFEREATINATDNSSEKHPHRVNALLISAGSALAFIAGIILVYFFR